MVLNVHATEVAADIAAVDDMAIGEDMCEGAFLAEFAVSLDNISYPCPDTLVADRTLVKYLHGARSVTGSSECKNGHAFPAWQAPCR